MTKEKKPTKPTKPTKTKDLGEKKMKVSVERNFLLKAMGQAQSVVERRTTLPILSNVLIEAEGDGISFRTTDLDIEIISKITGMVETAGAITVSAHTLYEIVRKLPEGAMVQLYTDEATNLMHVSAGRSHFKLTTLPRDDFPIMASSEYQCNFSAPAQVLRRLFDKSKFAISTEETRYYLNGVYMHKAERDGKDVLRCVATDGHKLARIDAELPKGAKDMPSVIVPRKTVSEMRSLLEEDDSKIAVSVSETKVRFASAELTLTSKVIDGSFPDYNRVIPKDNPNRMEVDAKDLERAVDRVATISSERSRAVKMNIENDKLVLSVSAPDSGAAEEELGVAYDKTPMEIGFNAKYLLEIANQIEKDNAIFMFNTNSDPALIQEGKDDSTLYVVMPMRV